MSTSSPRVTTRCRYVARDITVIFQQTNTHKGRALATYQRGKRPIDGIFVSPNLHPEWAGYLPFRDLPGGHRGIWINVESKYVYGYTVTDTPIAATQRLKLNNPRVVDKYIKDLHALLQHYDLYGRVYRLRQSVWRTLTTAQAKEYKDIDCTWEKCMKKAKRRCRKLKMGGQKWSLELQKARDTI